MIVAMGGALRRWWPAIIIGLLAVISIDVLHSSFQRSQRSREEAVAAVDQLAQTRLRMMRAYLVLEGELGEEETFGGNAAAAELQAARDALDDWLAGRSAILNVQGRPAIGGRLTELAGQYEAALSDFHAEVRAGDPGRISSRRLFSNAEQAAHALESAVYADLRGSIREENRRYWMRLAVWSLVLLFAALGVSVARRRQRRAETARERSETRLARLRTLAPVGIIACDDDGCVRLTNHWWCDSTDRSEEEWLGRPWWEALPEAERRETADRWARVVGGDDPAAAELLLADTPDREGPVWVLARWAPNPVGDAEGRWVVTFTDVSERRQVEEELRQAQKMKVMGQLTGAIAHDFNNLLTIIVANAALLRESDTLPAEDQPLLDDLRHAADGGVELVRTLLQFSRRSELEVRPVDLRWVVDQNAGLAQRLLPKSISLEIEPGGDVPIINADAGTLQQILLNLVTNARDAMPDGGRITIAARRIEVGGPGDPAGSSGGPTDGPGRSRTTEGPGGSGEPGTGHDVPPGSYAVLLVQDTGSGISHEILDRVFEAFFTTKPPGEGTGLGLSTVQTLVRRHGGHVRVESRIGRGTVFRLYFPSAEEEEQAVDVPPRPMSVR